MAEKLLYSSDHIWVRVMGDKARLGLSPHKVETLGEISYVQIPEEGESVELGEPFGEVEGSDEVFELISPLTGVVVNVNEDLINDPALLMDDPLEDGWLIEISLEDPSELNQLMTEEDYEGYVEEEMEEEGEEEEIEAE